MANNYHKVHPEHTHLYNARVPRSSLSLEDEGYFDLNEQSAKQPRVVKCLFYVLINAAIIFGLLQCFRSLVDNLVDLTSIVNSYNNVEATYNTRQRNNQALTQNIKRYSSLSGIEELARNNLNKVAENETPVLIQ